jgi:hypothetical protein
MKQFAKLDDNNIVIDVLAVDDSVATDEAAGIAHLQHHHGWTNWKESYIDGTRKIPAGIGGSYDPDLDLFKDKQTFPSWVYNSETGLWEAPVPEPTWDPQTQRLLWDENIINWVVENN